MEGRRDRVGVVQVIFGLEIPVGRNQSSDTETESRVSKRRGTGSSLFGSCVQQRACYLSKAGRWVGSFLHCNHWGQPAAFSATLLSNVGPDSRTIFCVFFWGVMEGPCYVRRITRPLSDRVLMFNGGLLVLIVFGLLFILVLGCN